MRRWLANPALVSAGALIILLGLNAWLGVPHGTLARSPEQVRLPVGDTVLMCPGEFGDESSAEALSEFESVVVETSARASVRAAAVALPAPDGSSAAVPVDRRTLAAAPSEARPSPSERVSAEGGYLSGQDEISSPTEFSGQAATEHPAFLSATQTLRMEGSVRAGLATGACASPVNHAVFPHASTTAGETTRVVMLGAGDIPAQVEFELLGSDGPMRVLGTSSLTVPPGEERALDLASLAPNVDVFGVEMTVAEGVVSAFAERASTSGINPGGIEFPALQDSALAPQAQSQVVQGSGGHATVRITNMEPTALSFELQNFTEQGQQDLDESFVSVPARGTAELDLGIRDIGAYRITATAGTEGQQHPGQPRFAASVRVDRGDEQPDFALYSSTPALSGPHLLVLPEADSSELVLAPGAGEVRLRGIGDGGVPMSELNLRLDPERAQKIATGSLGQIGAIEIETDSASAAAVLAVTDTRGVSAVQVPPPPAGVGYRDVRLWP